MQDTSPTLAKYARHQRATLEWLLRSLARGRGGSCAHFSLAGGWSKPCPETTGQLIATLLALAPRHAEFGLKTRAIQLGRWLLSIQNPDGSWNGGLHPSNGLPWPSVFNTGQVLNGLLALFRAGCGQEFLVAAARGATWLRVGQDERGLWPVVDYRASLTPSYYTSVFWPMLDAWLETGDSRLRAGAEAGLETVLARVRDNGAIERSGFGDDGVAFTHTIASTLRGLLECSRLLDAWDDVGARAVPALERLLHEAQSRAGRLPGEFDEAWNARGDFECLAGSAQTAIALLMWERESDDPRIARGAASLVERVCATQNLRHPIAGLRGAVAGSWPIWGRYMTLRYPNWAAKYHCDALELLAARGERATATSATGDQPARRSA
jgi:hypothetical protein